MKKLKILILGSILFHGTSAAQPRIAFFTAIYGKYEDSCKPFAKQTIPTDFICFTNLDRLAANEWIIDKTPYHETNPSPLDHGRYINSIKNNIHTFNIAKYYKQNFTNIPRLKDYEVLVWLDGTIEITNPKVAEWILEKIKQHPIIGWEHWRNGKLAEEVKASDFHRYTSTFWFGQPQPYQDIYAQYDAYIKDGFNDKDYWSSIDKNKPQLGLWVTCFVAFDNKNTTITKNFLDLWYQQTLQYTTQDQIGFPYVVQKLNMIPYTLPDSEIIGTSDRNNFYIKHDHGKGLL